MTLPRAHPPWLGNELDARQSPTRTCMHDRCQGTGNQTLRHVASECSGRERSAVHNLESGLRQPAFYPANFAVGEVSNGA